MPEPRRTGVLSPFVGGDYYGAVIAGVHSAAGLGGDEFVILLDGLPGPDAAELVVQHRARD